MDKLLWYIYYIAIKFFWKALCKCFINLSIAVHDNSSRNFWTLSEFPFCPLYHYTPNTQHQEETWLIVILFMEIIFPLPVCFECIWLIPFLNQQPTDKSKMKQQNLPSIICFLDSPLSVSALTKKRSKWLWVGCAFFHRCLKSTEEWLFWMELLILYPILGKFCTTAGWGGRLVGSTLSPFSSETPGDELTWLSPPHSNNNSATHTLSIYNLTHGSTSPPCSYQSQVKMK